MGVGVGRGWRRGWGLLQPNVTLSRTGIKNTGPRCGKLGEADTCLSSVLLVKNNFKNEQKMGGGGQLRLSSSVIVKNLDLSLIYSQVLFLSLQTWEVQKG